MLAHIKVITTMLGLSGWLLNGQKCPPPNIYDILVSKPGLDGISEASFLPKEPSLIIKNVWLYGLQ